MNTYIFTCKISYIFGIFEIFLIQPRKKYAQNFTKYSWGFHQIFVGCVLDLELIYGSYYLTGSTIDSATVAYSS